jgi:hypothetical protein
MPQGLILASWVTSFLFSSIEKHCDVKKLPFAALSRAPSQVPHWMGAIKKESCMGNPNIDTLSTNAFPMAIYESNFTTDLPSR